MNRGKDLVKMGNKHLEFLEIQTTSNKKFRQHPSPAYQMIFIRQGVFCCQTESLTYDTIETGDILLFPPEISYTLTPLNHTSGIINIIKIEPSFWNTAAATWPQLGYCFEQASLAQNCLLRTSYVTWSGLFSVLDMALSEQYAQDFGWQTNLDFILLLLVMHLGRTYHYQNITDARTEKRILDEQIVAYIDTHINVPLTLQSVADQFHVCRETISRLFRKKYDCTFYQYIHSQRLVAAKNSILAGIPLKSIWESTGFSDYSSFYRAFKREYGCSPSEYRKKRLEHV